MKKFLRWIQNQLSDGIERTTVGTIMMFGCFACIAYLTVREGGSGVVESLITTAMIVSATLMGVTSIADIFKVNKTTITNTSGGVTSTYEESRRPDEDVCEDP